MTTKIKYALASVAILTSFAAGRWLAPERVKTIKEIVTVKEKQKVKVVEKEVHRVTTITETPDGKKVTVIQDNSTQSSNTNIDTHSNTNSTETTEITRGTSKVTLSALGGFKIGEPTPVFGGAISKPALGPITIGAFYLSNQTVGGSLGLTF